MPCARPSDRQPDLFLPQGPTPSMVTVERRTELVSLVGALLAEILAALAAREAGDEDHA